MHQNVVAGYKKIEKYHVILMFLTFIKLDFQVISQI